MRLRGQSLVLWSLCLLLLSLLVFMNLSIAHRTKERMRMQELADASAYDQAVITARYFNALAILNRAAAADGAALAGHHAVVSYASFVRSALADVRGGLQNIKGSFDGCCGNRFCRQRGCACGEAGQIAAAITALDDFQALNYPDPLWKGLDLAAAKELYAMQRHARTLATTQQLLNASVCAGGGLLDRATTNVLDVAAPAELATGKIRLPFEQQAPSSAVFRPYQRSLQVVGGAHLPRGGGVYGVLPMVAAAHAARPTDFITARAGQLAQVKALVTMVLGPAAASVGWTPRRYWGTSALGIERETANTYAGARNVNLLSHDHSPVAAWSWKGGAACSGPDQPNAGTGASQIFSYLTTSVAGHSGGGAIESEHFYEGAMEANAMIIHDIGALPGVQMLNDSVELNEELLTQESMLFGQPLMPSLVVKELKKADPLPWDLTVRFAFTPAGAGLDLAQRDAVLSRQVAMGGGLVYYHRAARPFRTPPRPGGPPVPPSTIGFGNLSSWKEPANLWNPFWRASAFFAGQGPREVVQRGITSQPGDDRVYWLKQYGLDAEADALTKLDAAGYRGTR